MQISTVCGVLCAVCREKNSAVSEEGKVVAAYVFFWP